MTIDRDLGAAGYFREFVASVHLCYHGALNRDQASTMLERLIESRTERAWSRGQVGAIRSAGEFRVTRTGRPLVDAPSASIDSESELTPAFRRGLATIAEKQAAAKARADAAVNGDVVNRPLNRY
jgi:hypothetical protein